MAKRATIRIGISGWTYPPWRGVFYPDKLPHKRELEFSSRQFRAIEINGTFYGLQRPESFRRWRDETPDGFMFAVKAPRYVTHIRRLRDIRAPVANFLASGLLELGEKMGPILWQFPPNQTFEAQKFADFLHLLPHDTEAAAELAHAHDNRLKGRVAFGPAQKRKMRHAVEIRHESFRDEAFVKLLRRTKTALVCADTVEWPRLMDVTSDFFYCRLHGSEQLYASGYDDKALDDWARRVKAWHGGGEPNDAERVLGPARQRRSGRDVFVFFDNDMKVKAPENARELEEKVK